MMSRRKGNGGGQRGGNVERAAVATSILEFCRRMAKEVPNFSKHFIQETKLLTLDQIHALYLANQKSTITTTKAETSTTTKSSNDVKTTLMDESLLKAVSALQLGEKQKEFKGRW
jgi:hypothetical protein